ncbi:MAG TPA: CAP domain-containing protein [Longimicrobium sp.]|nr:CAP domain-containing protein [Longimicrobium sp.]
MRWIVAGAAAALAASCITIQVPPPAPSAGTNGGGSSASPPPAAGGPVSAAPGGQRAVEEMVALVNAHRRRVGCPELVWMQAVANAAQGHSDDMARRNYFDHRSPEGRGPTDRLAAAGVTYRALAENIAQHPGTPRDVLAGWLASPGHRQNLENCTYTHHGIGVREGYWTHMFVTPLPPPSGS